MKQDHVDQILKCSILEVMMKYQKNLIQKMKDGLKFGMMYSCNIIKKKMEQWRNFQIRM